MFIRPGIIRLIPVALVGVVWIANTALAYMRGRKALKKEGEKGDFEYTSKKSR